MNLLSIGASYRTADVAVLERLTIPETEVPAILQKLVAQPYVSEAVVVSTCNRVEVYAAVSGFHGGLGDICNVFAQHSGIPANELAGHLYVHYGEAAVRHSFQVSSGLDSMVIGEAQILGQLRNAYHSATESDTLGRLLHELMQQALRVGKRAHAETGIDKAGQSVVTAALDVAAEHLGGDLTGRSALVVGAGAMGALSIATLTRTGVGPLRITNRSADRAERLAEAYGATAVPIEDLERALSEVDIVVSATASTQPVLTRDRLSTALAARTSPNPLIVLDLAVPRDVAPDAAGLPGLIVVDIDGLARAGRRRDRRGRADRRRRGGELPRLDARGGDRADRGRPAHPRGGGRLGRDAQAPRSAPGIHRGAAGRRFPYPAPGRPADPALADRAGAAAGRRAGWRSVRRAAPRVVRPGRPPGHTR